MEILVWLILGLVAGWIASMVMGRGSYGVLGDIVVGILGALLGGWLGTALFGVGVTGFNVTSVIVAVIGAIILIAVYRALLGQRQPTL
jgi:uncharacterized membrane protein YeaQ/YmgE (transglycosylase-associated protein family)